MEIPRVQPFRRYDAFFSVVPFLNQLFPYRISKTAVTKPFLHHLRCASSMSHSTTYSQAQAFKISVQSLLTKPTALPSGMATSTYSKIGKLCAFFPPHIPILATLATLTPSALQEVHSQLSIDINDCFFLNCGNDHPNIAYSVLPINSAINYNFLLPFLTSKQQSSTPDNTIKSLVFINKVLLAQFGLRETEGLDLISLGPLQLPLHPH